MLHIYYVFFSFSDIFLHAQTSMRNRRLARSPTMPTTCFTQIHRMLCPIVTPFVHYVFAVFQFIVILSPIAFYLYYHIVQCQTAHDALCVSSCCRRKREHSHFLFSPAFAISIFGFGRCEKKKSILFFVKIFCQSYRCWCSCKISICGNKPMQANPICIQRAA